MASLKDVKRLRQLTGRSIAEINEALEKAEGDLERAKSMLATSGELIVERKSAREAKQGLIESYSHHGRIGVLVEVNVETDFAAKSEKFREFVHDLALQISAAHPDDVAALLKQPFIKDELVTIEQLLKTTIATVGENIVIRRFVRYELGE